ncbi:uncharacterized protein PV06_04386 [Exophiala oligosperma]|uniref:Uncharacterized protein n=1 Tax=Exophiala oligosperma TaxID=215243 RepID=A0A0D2DLF8_9EURO|nr:uncharacterized protein PV06_04386 [Exophiala oligosperma]KIW43265.1 hypothetical protein PV06_04386 [Exophiala oligosperma]
MAVFYDLEDDDCASGSRSGNDLGSAQSDPRPYHTWNQLNSVTRGATVGSNSTDDKSTAVTANKLAAALTCYPVALSLASSIDLNDLHALSSTCKSVNASLTQFAHQLKTQSLRCVHDDTPLLTERLSAQRAEPQLEELLYDTLLPTGAAASRDQYQSLPGSVIPARPEYRPVGLYTSSGVTSKLSPCARDLVAPCRRCGIVVCRNCTAKPPSSSRMKNRYRRLCKTCLDAPIEAHLQPLRSSGFDHRATKSSASSIRSERSVSGSSTASSEDGSDEHGPEHEYHITFTTPAFLRKPCTCDSHGIFLCMPCAQNLGASDTTYQRVWTWRSRYSTHIGGGLGTGLGVGNQGQKCGRGEDCLESSGKAVCWVEIECSEGKGCDDAEGSGPSRTGTPDYVNNKPGYLQQEIEGIGGVVKKKVKKRVKVGATVWEYEDERESGKYLERESQGIMRSWCGWCRRVCPGPEDRQQLNLRLVSGTG